jgi:hypothetical protein
MLLVAEQCLMLLDEAHNSTSVDEASLMLLDAEQ